MPARFRWNETECKPKIRQPFFGEVREDRTRTMRPLVCVGI
jgi:hypothetical protein